jgi:hypothetical protein
LVERIRRKRSQSKSVTSAPAPRLTLFGQLQLLAGEDGAAYDELLARICAAVKPVDIIDEILIVDVASLEWEVLRGRRSKWSLVQTRGLGALEDFLRRELDYELYSDDFADRLTEILQDNLLEDQADSVQTLAHACARNESDAVDKVQEILAGINLDIDNILDDARGDKAKELVQEYVRGEPDAVTLVHELLTGAGELLRRLLGKNPPDVDAVAEFVSSTPQAPQKFALILAQETKQLLAMDRYERQALARRKFAIRAFDAARTQAVIARG